MRVDKFCLSLLLAWVCSLTAISGAHASTQWRNLNPDNTLLLELATGVVVIELNPRFAPKHVAQVKALASKGFYNNLDFYRVIDGFVAQGGIGESEKPENSLTLEAEVALAKTDNFIVIDGSDPFAPQTGFINDFASGLDAKTNTSWLLHCPGTVAMARNNAADSANTEFYITIGQAPRYLDKIMTIFGRVVYGMEHVQKLNRTQAIEGEDTSKRVNSKIISFNVMSNIKPDQQIHLQVEDTSSSKFQQSIKARRERQHEFFFKKPPQVLDICQFPLKTRVKKL